MDYETKKEKKEIQERLRRLVKSFLALGVLLFSLSFSIALISGANLLKAFDAGLVMLIRYILIWIVVLTYFLIHIKCAEKKQKEETK